MIRSSLLSFGFCLSLFFMGCKEVPQEKTLTQQIRQSTDKGLKDWGDFPIGSAINVRKILKDRKLDSITKSNFSSLTATNDMKMYAIVKNDSVPDFTRSDSLLAYSKANKMRLFGHALVWHYALPKWISETTTGKGADWTDAFLKKYIDTVVTRYKGDVVAWDVVNEAFDTKTGEYRKTFWYETLGPEYIEKAFRYAHEADPKAQLFYNDFGQEKYPGKMDSIVAMIADLQKRDVPIHGIGLQMHLEMATTDAMIAEALKKAARTGLLVHISELDIIFNRHNEDLPDGGKEIIELTEDMKRAQAEKFEQVAVLYRQYIPKDQQFGITFWEFNDRDSWLKPLFDGKEWPTIFDENLEPKPAYYSFAEGLSADLEN